jgi:uncharacterized protein YeeX (DUF496 family)
MLFGRCPNAILPKGDPLESRNANAKIQPALPLTTAIEFSAKNFTYLCRSKNRTMKDTITIDKQHVEKRVKDWKKRVNDLYSTLKDWLKGSDYSLRLGRKLTMYEEPMAEYKIPAAEIDTADIYKGNKILLSFKPNGLWIIGVNGKINILTTNGSYSLLDYAEEFEAPQWKLFNGDKMNGVRFTKEAFLQLLK